MISRNGEFKNDLFFRKATLAKKHKKEKMAWTLRMLICCLLTVGLVGLVSVSGYAATQYWDGSTDGDWTDATNWESTPLAADDTGPPAAGDDIIINFTGATADEVITAMPATAFNSLTIIGDDEGALRTVTATGGVNITTSISITGGAAAADDATLVPTGSISAASVTLTGTAGVASITLVNATLTVTGNLTIDTGTSGDVVTGITTGTGTIQVGGNIDLTGTGANGVLLDPTGAAGIVLNGTGDQTIDLSFTDHDVDLDDFATTLLVSNTGGTVTFIGTEVAPFGGTSTINLDATVVLSSTDNPTITAAATTVNGSLTSTSGDITCTTLQIGPSGQISTVSGELNATGAVGGTAFNGTITTATGILDFDATVTVGATGTLSVTGAGTLELAGDLINSSGGTVSMVQTATATTLNEAGAQVVTAGSGTTSLTNAASTATGLTFDGSGDIDLYGDFTSTTPVAINGANTTVTVKAGGSADFTLAAATFTITDGSFVLEDGVPVTFGGNFANNDALATAFAASSSSVITFDITAASISSSTNGVTFDGPVLISDAGAGAIVVTITDGDVTFNQNVQIGNADELAVALTADDGDSIITVASGKTIALETATSVLDLDGSSASNARIVLKSGTAGSTFNLDASAAGDNMIQLNQVAIRDCALTDNATPGALIVAAVAPYCISAGGNNTAWSTVTYPNLRELTPASAIGKADTSYAASWTTLAADDTITYDIYIDTSNTLTASTITNGDNIASAQSASYTWDTTLTTPGMYYLYLRPTGDSDYVVVSNYYVRITRAYFLTGASDEPLGDNDVATSTFTIDWSDNGGATGPTGSIYLYYSTVGTYTDVGTIQNLSTVTPTAASGVTLPVNETDTDNNVIWDVSGVTAGTYYIYIVFSDGGASYDVSGTLEVKATNVEILTPTNADTAATEWYTIEWQDGDSTNSANVWLYYSTSATLPGSDMSGNALTSAQITTFEGVIDSTAPYDTSQAVLINSSAISEDNDGSTDRYLWDLSSIDAGTYYIYALLDSDGNGSADSAYESAGTVAVTHNLAEADITVTAPASSAVAYDAYTIRWVDQWNASTAGDVQLYYDDEATHNTPTLVQANATPIALDLDEAGLDSSSYSWDVSDVDEGTYYIYAVLDTTGAPGQGPAASCVSDVSSGTLQVTRSFTVTLSNSLSEPEVGETFTLTIQLNTSNTTITSAAIYLDFSTSNLQLVTETTPFTDIHAWAVTAVEFQNTGSNTNGTANYIIGSATAGANTSTATSFASVDFVVQQAGDLTVEISSASGRATAFVDSSGEKRYPTVVNPVSGTALGTITGTIDLEGRTSDAEEITFELRRPGSLGNTSTWTPGALDEDLTTEGVQVTTSSDGTYYLTNVPTGYWYLTAKANNYLRRQNTDVPTSFTATILEITPGVNTVTYFQQLTGGECYDATNLEDNDIDADDLTTFANDFGTTETGSDIDGSGTVDVDDFTMLAANYGSDEFANNIAGPYGSAYPGVGNNNTAPSIEASEAMLAFAGIPERPKVGKSFKAQVVLKNVEKVRGYAFNVEYDPAQMRIVAHEGDFLAKYSSKGMPLFINKVTDTEDGRKIALAEALMGNDISGASGEGKVVTLTVTPFKVGPLAITLTDGRLMPISGKSKEITEIMRPVLEVIKTPAVSVLRQNYPNPFNPETWIPYSLKNDATVEIRIYNAAGQLVYKLRQGFREADHYVTKDRAAYWNGRNECGERAASGIYFYQIRAGNFAATRKMVILK